MPADCAIVRAGSTVRVLARRLSEDTSARALPIEVGGRVPPRAAARA